MKIRLLALATCIALAQPVSAAPLKNGQTIDQLISDIGMQVNEEISDILGNHVQRVGYTSLACAAGTAGIVTAYNGLKRLLNGIEENYRKKIYIGSSELALGLGIATTSITLIHYLWKKHGQLTA